jgi:hypothetical protein
MFTARLRRPRPMVATLAALWAVSGSPPGLAQGVAHSLVASPDIYKVIAENEQYRVIEVTWKPGQRDVLHSHPASAVFYPMDCSLRAYGPSGVLGQRDNKAGTAVVQAPIAAHAVENIGSAECKLIMFEPK